MKKDIILAGVGGQGILSIAAAIGFAAVHENLNIKQSEVHGMSQQGGEVYSHLRLSSGPIWSDLIPQGMADMILAVEPMEALRYLPYLQPGGWLITSSSPVKNIPEYPGEKEIMDAAGMVERHIVVDAVDLAKKAGYAKAANMVMLGAASPGLEISENAFIFGIKQLFSRKGQDVVETNIAAFHAGRAAALSKT